MAMRARWPFMKWPWVHGRERGDGRDGVTTLVHIPGGQPRATIADMLPNTRPAIRRARQNQVSTIHHVGDCLLMQAAIHHQEVMSLVREEMAAARDEARQSREMFQLLFSDALNILRDIAAALMGPRAPPGPMQHLLPLPAPGLSTARSPHRENTPVGHAGEVMPGDGPDQPTQEALGAHHSQRSTRGRHGRAASTGPPSHKRVRPNLKRAHPDKHSQ